MGVAALFAAGGAMDGVVAEDAAVRGEVSVVVERSSPAQASARRVHLNVERPVFATEEQAREHQALHDVYSKIKALPAFVHIPRARSADSTIAAQLDDDRVSIAESIASDDDDDADLIELTGDMSVLVRSLQAIVSPDTMGSRALPGEPLRFVLESYCPPACVRFDARLDAMVAAGLADLHARRLARCIVAFADVLAYVDQLTAEDSLAEAQAPVALDVVLVDQPPFQIATMGSPPPELAELDVGQDKLSLEIQDIIVENPKRMSAVDSAPIQPILEKAPRLSTIDLLGIRVLSWLSIGHARLTASEHDKAVLAYAEARQCFNAIMMGAYNTVNAADPLNAMIHSSLGTSCFHAGRPELALQAHYAALEMRLEYLNPTSRDYPDLATSFNNVAVCLVQVGRFDEAFVFLSGAFDIVRTRLPPYHPRVVTIVTNLDRLRTRSKHVHCRGLHANGKPEQLRQWAVLVQPWEMPKLDSKKGKSGKGGKKKGKGGKKKKK